MSDKRRITYLGWSTILALAAIVVNLALGHWIRFGVQWPLYLDSIGMILVGALLGPLPGAATGAISNLIWYGLSGNIAILPYAIVAAFIGWAAGIAASYKAFERFPTAVLAGFLVGFGAAVLAAPITAYVFGGATGGGVDYLTSYLAAAGANVLQAATIQGFLSDPLDKMISFAVVWLGWRFLHPYYRPVTRSAGGIFESLQGYSLAVLVNLLALLLCLVFLPAFERGIFSVFFIAVLLVAYRSGLGPALMTVAIGALAQILFLESPYYKLGVTFQDWLRVVSFVIVSVAIAIIADQLDKSRRELQRSLQAERESQARIRAIGERHLRLVRDMQRQAGLAHAAGAGERDQAHVRAAQEVAQRGRLLVAPEQGGERNRHGRPRRRLARKVSPRCMRHCAVSQYDGAGTTEGVGLQRCTSRSRPRPSEDVALAGGQAMV